MAQKSLEERQMKFLEQAGYHQEVEETQRAIQRNRERSSNGQIDEQERLNIGLFLAAERGNVSEVLWWIKSGADLNYHHPDFFGYTPLTQASHNGHLNIVQILTDAGCDTRATDNDFHWTSLHSAASMGHTEIVQLFLNIMKKETINAVAKFGDTALHNACMRGHLHTVEVLLKSGNINPLIRNSRSLTAIEVIPPCQHKTKILESFYPFITSHNSNSFVLDACAKVFICGNSGNGKSSLCQVISQFLYLGNDEFISNVVPLTAGIEVFPANLAFDHKMVNAVLYDFAGHPEYYSSHSAILENMLSSPAVFVILVKLTDTESAIKKQLYYWCNFIEDISIKTSCQVIVVGSYADEASDDQVILMKSVIDGVVQQAITRQSYITFLAVDCHRTIGKGVKEFISVLVDTCKDVIDHSHLVSYFCCTHYSFICDLKKHEKIITVEDLCSRLEEHNHPSLPSDETTVFQSLHDMKYYNLVLWLPDKENVSKGWLIIDEKALLKEINGVLFAPPAIGRVHHPNLSSNTGLISISTLASTFPSYNIHMLIGFLTTLQFCQVIKNETLKSISTNIRSSNEESMTSEDVLFFPSLVSIERGNDDVHMNGHFGWSLYCSDRNKFFSNRFLHTVLLHLALNRSLCEEPSYGEIDEIPPDVRNYNRRCHVWKNGIYWKDGSNEMEVEITDHNRCLTLLLSKCDKGKSLRIACTIISDILTLLKNHCSFTPHQYLISPYQLVNIHEVPINDRIVYHIQDIREALDDEEDEVSDVKQKNPILVSEFFGGFDPKMILDCCMGRGDNPLSTGTEESDAQLLQLKIQAHIKQEGKLNISVVKGILYGPPRVGKTSLMKRLIGEEPPKISPSNGIDSPITVPIYKDALFTQLAIPKGNDLHKDEWKLLGIEQTLQICLNYFNKPKEIAQIKTIESTVSSKGSVTPLAAASDIIVYDEYKESGDLESKSVEKLNNVTPHSSEMPKVTENKTDQKNYDINIPSKIVDFIKMKDWENVREELKGLEGMALFQIVDIGGQPEFHDILPLLLTGPAIYLLFFNLNQDPQKPYDISYQHKDESNSEKYKSKLTAFQVLHQILSSISSMPEFSPAIVIGTHLDELKSTDGKEFAWKPTDDPLKDRMKEHFYYKRNLIPNQVDGECCVVFPVDNINGTLEDEIKPLRLKIKAKLNELKGTPLPTSWALFYYLLKSFDAENDKNRYLTLDEAKQLAEGLNVKDVEEALKYFHEQFGSVLYYHDVEDRNHKKYVFRDPNVILRAVNELVAICFGSNSENLQIAEMLRNTGMVTHKGFEQLCLSFSDRHLCSYVIELLKSRHILSYVLVEETQRYFIPCLLQSSDDIKYTSSESEQVAPFLLKLSCKDKDSDESFVFIPPGLFSSTLVKLSNKPGWELISKKDFIYKNKVTFSFSCNSKPESISITLIAQDEWIEVRVNEEPTSLTPSCIDIREDIEKAINDKNSDTLLGSFLDSVELDIGFYCKEKHYAKIKKDNLTQMACSSCPNKYFQPLMDKHKIWFKKSNGGHSISDTSLSQIKATYIATSNVIHSDPLSTNQTTTTTDGTQPMTHQQLTEEPKLMDLARLLHPIKSQWRAIGGQLGIEGYELDSIEKIQH